MLQSDICTAFNDLEDLDALGQAIDDGKLLLFTQALLIAIIQALDHTKTLQTSFKGHVRSPDGILPVMALPH